MFRCQLKILIRGGVVGMTLGGPEPYPSCMSIYAHTDGLD